MIDETQILDLSVVLPGSYASLLLGDLGADVIKVERPPEGEITRSWDPQVEGEGYRFLARNRNKRSISIDLKTQSGVELFHELAADADVIIEGFRPGVTDRLGIGYEDVQEYNDEIIYCSITGFGQKGPNADMPGHDLNYCSVAGLLGANQRDEKPVIPGHPVGDLSAGMFSALSIIAALTQREKYGGQHVDISITDVVFSWNIVHLGELFGNSEAYDPQETFAAGGYACYNVYETADDEYISVGAVEEKFWQQFCQAINREELVSSHQAEENRLQRISEIQSRISTKSREEWLRIFQDLDVPVTPVNSIEDAFDSPQVTERSLLKTMPFDGSEITQIMTPFGFSEYEGSEPTSPPKLGEDTVEVLTEQGYTETQVQELLDDGILEKDDSEPTE